MCSISNSSRYRAAPRKIQAITQLHGNTKSKKFVFDCSIIFCEGNRIGKDTKTKKTVVEYYTRISIIITRRLTTRDVWKARTRAVHGFKLPAVCNEQSGRARVCTAAASVRTVRQRHL